MSKQEWPLWRMVGGYVLASGLGCGLLYGALLVAWHSGWREPGAMVLDLLGRVSLTVVVMSAAHGLWLLALPAGLTGWVAVRLGLRNNLRGRAASTLVWTTCVALIYWALQQAGLDVLPGFGRLLEGSLDVLMPRLGGMVAHITRQAVPWYLALLAAAVGGWLAAMLVLPYEREETWGDYTGERGEDW